MIHVKGLAQYWFQMELNKWYSVNLLPIKTTRNVQVSRDREFNFDIQTKMTNRKIRYLGKNTGIFSDPIFFPLLFPTSKLYSMQLKKEISAWFHADWSAAHRIKQKISNIQSWSGRHQG